MENQLKRLEHRLIQKNASLIEETLSDLKFKAKITEINIKNKYIEFCLKVDKYTNLKELAKHEKDIALATASPTGKVELVVPLPGRPLIAIRLPKPDKKYLLTALEDDKSLMTENPTNLIEKLSNKIFFLSKYLERLSQKIYTFSLKD